MSLEHEEILQTDVEGQTENENRLSHEPGRKFGKLALSMMAIAVLVFIALGSKQAKVLFAGPAKMNDKVELVSKADAAKIMAALGQVPPPPPLPPNFQTTTCGPGGCRDLSLGLGLGLGIGLPVLGTGIAVGATFGSAKSTYDRDGDPIPTEAPDDDSSRLLEDHAENACEAYSACKSSGLTGMCCPGSNGVHLDCCNLPLNQ